MPSSTWKRVESRIASLFGCQRISLSGSNNRQAKTQSDTDHERLYIEIKHRKRIPFYATWKEVRERAGKEGKVPIVVLHEKNSDFALAICQADYLAKLENDLIDMENRP